MTPQEAATLAAIAQAPPTAAPTFGDLGSRAVWNLHTLAGEAVCDLGEWAMKRQAARAAAPTTRKPNRRPTVPALAFLGYVARKAAKS
jgi:hypothetical protein